MLGSYWPDSRLRPQPEILGISPAKGPEGTRVEINGKNLAEVCAVLFGTTQAVFDAASPHKLVAIVPHKVSTSIVTVITPHGQTAADWHSSSPTIRAFRMK